MWDVSRVADEDLEAVLGGFYGYQSPFAEWTPRSTGSNSATEYQLAIASDAHYQWQAARKNFESTGERGQLDLMLACVTMANPPSSNLPIAPLYDPETYQAAEPESVGFRIIMWTIVILTLIVVSHIVFP